MRENCKNFMVAVLVAIMMMALFFWIDISRTDASTGLNMEGTTIKGYPCTDQNFPTFDRTDAQRIQNGTCYGRTDWIVIYGVGDDGWSLIEYPTSKGTKRGYCQTSNLFQNPDFSGTSGLVQSSITTYKKANCSSKYGTSTKNDRIFIV